MDDLENYGEIDVAAPVAAVPPPYLAPSLKVICSCVSCCFDFERKHGDDVGSCFLGFVCPSIILTFTDVSSVFRRQGKNGDLLC